MKQLTSNLFCHSTQWLTLSRPYCRHCLRISIEGVTLDGEIKRINRKPINFRNERLQLVKLYRNTHALRKRRLLERRVFNSLGYLFP